MKVRVRIPPSCVVIVSFGDALEDAAHMRVLVRDLLRPSSILRRQCAFLVPPFSNRPHDDTASVASTDDESFVDIAARHPLQRFADCLARPVAIVTGRGAVAGQQLADAQVAALGAAVSRAQRADFGQPCGQFHGIDDAVGIGARNAVDPLE